MQPPGGGFGVFAKIKRIEIREAGVSGHGSLRLGIFCTSCVRLPICLQRPNHASMTSLSILTLHGFLLFAGAELIFSLTPGPTVMLISAYGFKGGFRDGLAAIAGTQTGNTLWYVICVTGLGALVTASPLLFQGIKLLGAAYLVWLGTNALWKSWRAGTEALGPKLIGKPYLQALLT